MLRQTVWASLRVMISEETDPLVPSAVDVLNLALAVMARSWFSTDQGFGATFTELGLMLSDSIRGNTGRCDDPWPARRSPFRRGLRDLEHLRWPVRGDQFASLWLNAIK